MKTDLHNFSIYNLYRDVVEKVSEAHATTDFPKALGQLMQAQILNLYQVDTTTNFSRWTKASTVSTYRPEERYALTNIGLMKRRREGQGATETSLKEISYLVQTTNWALEIEITREMVINDNLGIFNDLAQQFVNSALDTQAEEVIKLLTTPGNAYDGFPFYVTAGDRVNDSSFSISGGGIWTPTLEAAQALVSAGIVMETYTDPFREERYVGMSPDRIVMAPTYIDRVRTLLTVEEVVDTVNDTTIANPARGLIPVENVIKETRLLRYGDDRSLYMFTNPAQRAAFEIAYLRGKTDPVVYLKERPTTIVAGSDSNPPRQSTHDYPFDDITYRAQLDFEPNLAEPRGVYRLTCLG